MDTFIVEVILAIKKHLESINQKLETLRIDQINLDTNYWRNN
jgi:hypothetical protein